MMNIKDLKNKKVCLLGLGLENLSLAKYLVKRGIAVSVLDKRSGKELGDRYEAIKKIKAGFYGNPNYLDKISNFDIVFKTPGFIGKLKLKNGLPAGRHGTIITTPMELFFDLCPAKIIAVTGTKGKGTVASLCHHVLIHSNKKAYLAGNIGKAPFDFISELKPDHFVVLELSSFQLIDFKKRPYIAVITNLFPEHLSPADPINPIFHGSLKEYYGAKANLFLNQKQNDWLVVNKNNHHGKSILKKSKAKKIYFKTNKNLPKNQFLIGNHNQENIAAVFAVTKILKIPEKIIINAIKTFSGLKYHLEFVSSINGIKFYNDSASTMPQATLAAINSFKKPLTLILGGVNKGYDLVDLSKKLKTCKNLKLVILIGKTYPIFLKILKKLNPNFQVITGGKNIASIVKKSLTLSKRGDIVVFSPGFASFDMFKNSKDRGEKFKRSVLKLRG
ncbi:MAG: UDP-N-acetylmuramoyl-L-alanine--D-glutamate ligase [Parcubacteria group bacterium]|nr:UDP-N-acetylmuramoyl-L-alanine--D-glutamate ligase [Parcubacteria group bacterium]